MLVAKVNFDPSHLPIDAVAGEPAIDADLLTPSRLRVRFANARRAWEPETGEETPFQPGLKLRRAAVLVPLVARPEGLTVLLTQRTEHLSSHGGQISFPGGRAEELDSSPIETALRETEEEIGLHRRHIEILGVLPEYITASAYRIRPVVALVMPPFDLLADPNEVAEIFEVPLAFLMSGAHHQRMSFELPEGAGRRSFYAMPYEKFFIWGATAGMLRNLFHFLRAGHI
ncbi:CoA pyrophosphatase [Massilia sp. Dwa41.01b]|uniref:CoA pyrophosphatase n=1 Tax=unclassified Massilia TaxID=2609279 RepID=UPI0015FF05EA|nr:MULTISPECIES: CoA pyrophosphatase [unclassified Massilia]QNA88337.1 CoA pyrophosphatase [Massilia sp. Dwa41.01b]QNA99236.1 CoA pyrophosphatase [Massilia sp. Se16.2.3]